MLFSCGGCNGHKYIKTEAMDSVSGKIAPLFHPRKDNWNEHFKWSTDYLKVIGITPVEK